MDSEQLGASLNRVAIKQSDRCLSKEYPINATTSVNVHTLGNLYFSWPNLFNTFSHGNFIFSAQMHSFSHYASVHVKNMDIDAKC